MNISDIKDGMKLKGVGQYADDCIVTGGDYVCQVSGSGEKLIVCGCGEHHFLESTADDDGEIPELEPVP